MNKLNIGTKQNGVAFHLPSEAVTQTFAILAKRGVGKTYTANVMAEEMLKLNQQIVALDPTGAWWGLRSAYPIVIFGGEHADVPLKENAGEIVATAIVENRFSAVLDLSLFRKGEMIRFMVSFAETLYRLNREALHLFVDEADAVAPQARNYGGDENRMLGAMEDIVRRGRRKGIGCTLITQRPAVLNKNVLTQCEVLVAMRLVHPKDINAIEEWVNVHADPKQAKDMIDSLPSLPVGTAWFWSPGLGDIFDHVKVRRRETFDSSSTPKPGESPRQPKTLTAIDKQKLGHLILDTIEKAEADDPKNLKKVIADLQKQLKDKPAAVPIAPPPVVLPDLSQYLDLILGCAGAVSGQAEIHRSSFESLKKVEHSLTDAIKSIHVAMKAKPNTASAKITTAAPHFKIVPPPKGEYVKLDQPTDDISKCERALLTALVQCDEVAEDSQLALVSGYSIKSSSFHNALSSLRTKGLIAGSGRSIQILGAGHAAVGKVPALPSGADLANYWINKCGKCEGTLLREIVKHAHGVNKDDLSVLSGYSVNSSSFHNALSALRTLKLITGSNVLIPNPNLL